MNKPTMLLCCLLLYSLSYGQDISPIDSLRNELGRAQDDTLKVEILLRLFNPTVTNDPDRAYDYAEQALHLSEKLSFDKGIAAAYQRMGIFWNYRGHVAKAKENYLKAIEIHRRLERPVVAATLIYNLGLLYHDRGIYDSALLYNEKAAKIFLAHDDSLKYASCLDLWSSIYNERGEYYLNLKYATEAAKLFHKFGDELREADNLLKIGQVYTVREKHLSAIDYYQSAIRIYKKYNDRQWENYALQNIARAWLSMNDLKKADSVNEITIMLSHSLGAVQVLSEGYDIKGEILFKKGAYRQALGYFQKALKNNKNAADSTFFATEMIAIGRCYQKLGMHGDAKKAFLSALPVSARMKVRENLSAIYKHLSEINEQNGSDGMALDYYKKHVTEEDSMNRLQYTRQFADMQARYDAEGKAKEIALQNQTITILEQKAEINELIHLRLIVTIIVVILFFLMLLYMLRLRTKEKQLAQTIENERLRYELDLKKQDLTTHMLHIIQKNELLEKLRSKIKELGTKDRHTHNSYHEISRIIDTNKLIEKDWMNFRTVFEQIHPGFFENLKIRYPKISTTELRMAAMMKMNLTTKEMASILNITASSVRKAKYRMRKKFSPDAVPG